MKEPHIDWYKTGEPVDGKCSGSAGVCVGGGGREGVSEHLLTKALSGTSQYPSSFVTKYGRKHMLMIRKENYLKMAKC